MKERDQRTFEKMVDEVEQLGVKCADYETRLQKALLKIDQLQRKVAESPTPVAGDQRIDEMMIKELRMSQLIVNRSPVILFRRAADETAKLEYISENCSQLGYVAEEFLSGEITFKDIVHPDDGERVGREIEQFAENDVEEYSQLYRCVQKNGEVRWIQDETTVVRDENGRRTHTQGILQDITERRLAELALEKSEEKYRRIVETTAEGFLLMDQQLVILDVNIAYCRMVGYSREELIGLSAFDLLKDESKMFLELNREELLAKEYREFETIGVTKEGIEIPILIHGNTLRDDDGNVIGNMAFITDMTEHKKALELAGEVQKSLLPQEKPLVNGLDIAGRNVSCDEIGGDYFDFLFHKESGQDDFSIVVGDISGHGVDSALLMTTARAFLRMRASQPGTIGEILSAMNRHLASDVLESGRFMTLFFLCIDPEKGNIRWVRAGHDPALLYDPEQDSFEELAGEGIALGIINDALYKENQRENMRDGQIVAIGTDGIWESFNREGAMFGKERLKEIIREKSDLSAGEILDAVYDALGAFTAGCRSMDDITLVIVKIDFCAETIR